MAPRSGGPSVRSVVDNKLSAVDLVTAEIRRAILTGELAPDHSFAVTDISSQLGISHIPVREALRRLEAQGLVVLSTARRPKVAPLNVDDLNAIYDLRLRLEPPLLARAVMGRADAWIVELEGLLCKSFDGDTHPDSQWEHHRLLHQALVRPAASNWEIHVLQQLWDAAERYTRLVFDPQDIAGPDDRAHRQRAHQDLLDPVRAGDPDAAAASLHNHLTNNLTIIRALVDKALNGTG